MLEPALLPFKKISLAGINELSLMKRVDSKFLIAEKDLPSLLGSISDSYECLQIENKSLLEYQTTYYDTADFEFYKEHIRGRTKRIKVRIREYVESQLHFLEIKRKDNKGVTNKKRQKTHQVNDFIEGSQSDYVNEVTGIESGLELKLVNKFRRITLVNFKYKERVTIDTGLSFWNSKHAVDIPNLCIVEIKQPRVNRFSPIFKTLKSMKYYPKRISKYCLGVSMIYDNVKKNTMLSKYNYINKLAS